MEDIKKTIAEYSKIIEDNMVSRRKLLEDASRNKETRDHIMNVCAKDPKFFFNYFLFTDKNSGFFPQDWGSMIPFILFPYQEDFVDDMFDAFLTSRKPLEERFQFLEEIDKDQRVKHTKVPIPTDIFVDKSRQMGLSWVITGFLLHIFIFHKAKGHVISQKDDYVDKAGDIKSIFEKFRFMIRLLPDWMLPDGLEKESGTEYNKTKLIGRADGTGVLTGESSNPNAGTGGTYDVIFLDEMSKIGHASQINTSCSRATPMRIMNGTPLGKTTEFYRMRKKAEEGAFRWHHIHWSEHPFYSDDWYEAEKMKSTPEQIAQELDISYDNSMTGRVYPDFAGEMYDIEFDYLKPLFVSIDNSHGGSDPHAIVVSTKDPKTGIIEVIDSCEFNCSVTEMAHILAGRKRKVLARVESEFYDRYVKYTAIGRAIFISDPHDYKATLNESTIYQEYEKVGIVLNAPKMRRNLKQQILITRNNLHRLRVKEGNEAFIDCIMNAHYPRSVGSVYDDSVDTNDTSTRTKATNEPVHDWTSHMRSNLEYLINYITENEVMDKTRQDSRDRRENRTNHPHKNIFPDEFNQILKQNQNQFIQGTQMTNRRLMQTPEKRNYLTGEIN